ncbi:MAG: Mov34/MPN/PAD-1 family protein [Euryarchaeota archaeon]|nr:Mov34/MPN/PAD-1 family protein [Euryarchaeota archaeon]
MQHIKAIRRKALRMILSAGRDSLPNEFGTALRAQGGVITELILVPGTLSGERSALMRLHMLPIDLTIVGSAHTHPSGSCMPSEADLDFFSHFGYVHIIACHPFTERDWACYNIRGERMPLEVV